MSFDRTFLRLALMAAAVALLHGGGLVEYNAVSDREVRPLPALPEMGPAGAVIVDPTFKTRIVRVTDEKTEPAMTGYYATTSGSFVQAWSQDSTRFFTHLPNGGYGAFELDVNTLGIRYLGSIPLTGPCWGGADRDVVYGMWNRAIAAYNIAERVQTTVLALDDVVPGWKQSTYALSCTPDGNVFAVSFGGIQDTHKYLVHYDRRTGRKQLLDLTNGTADGRALPFSAPPSAGFHSQDIDKTGRYVSFIGPGLPGKNAIFWDAATGAVTPQTKGWSGHAALGYGTQVNQSGYGLDGISDGRGFTLRYLDRPDENLKQLIAPAPPAPYGWTYGGHWSWNNARPDVLAPLVGSFYKESASREWSVWDGEIVAVRTDGVESKVWRFAHHRSVTDSSSFGWDQPHGNVSPDGRWFIFTSNWGKSLGTTPQGTRRDVFLVELPLAGAIADAAPIAPIEQPVEPAPAEPPPAEPPPVEPAPVEPAPVDPEPVPEPPPLVATSVGATIAPELPNENDVVTFAALVVPAEAGGTVTFRWGDTLLGTAVVEGGVATLSVSLPAGAYSVAAEYSGDATHAPSSALIGFEVRAAVWDELPWGKGGIMW